MPVSQLQRPRPQQPGAKPMLSRKVSTQDQDHSSVPAQAVTTGLNASADLGQHQAIVLMEQQSQKVVQDLISAAIGCITYLRGLIPEKSFCDMSYGGTTNESQLQNQSGFISQESDMLEKKKASGTRIKHIRRGFSSEADTLLDLIERGIFSALSKGYLKAFQLAVFLDINNPEVIQEAYTFSINYHARESGKLVDIKDILMSTVIQNGASCDHSAELLDIAQINRSVRALIRRLIVITQNLDLLPENRYLTIRLYHTPDAPGDWTPPMFTQSTGKPLWFNGETSNNLSDEIFGSMETGLHSVQVRVTSGKRPFSDAQVDGSDSEDGTPHPLKKQCHSGLIGVHNFIDFTTSAKHHAAQPNGGNHQSSQDSFSSSAYGSANRDLLTPGDRAHEDVDGCPFGTRKPPQYDPLGGMTHTIQIGGQEAEHPYAFIRIEQSQESTLPGLEHCQSVATVPSLRLGELKLDELVNTIRGIDQHAENGRKTESSQIKCECGGDTENMDTIQCDLCDMWQHCECYGFVGDSDPRIGSVHVCYTCLLGKDEPYLLQQMCSFTIARRIIRCLLRSKMGRTLHDITKTIGIEALQQSVATGILSVLTEKGYICAFNPRKVATKRSPNKYKVVETDGILKSIEENLLNPLVNISHHYDLSDTPESTRQSCGASSLQFELPMGARAGYSQGQESRAIETPKQTMKTSDIANHLKAGNWS
ncbi:DNA binding protein [Arthrobotrys megalospora]